MASVTTTAQMQVFVGKYNNQPQSISLGFNSQPKGMLKIKNQTTGAEKMVSVNNVASGEVIWTKAADDPTQGANDLYTLEFSGRSDNTYIQAFEVTIDGNGHAEISGLEKFSI